ncbi:hypothetical protein Tsubulata_026582 [Turnera subulata]|uniref:DUF3685 domain-containing protein n=1 Tax=Turnera subulata TaxID=218843 RepID=A0A9Q0JHU6_9ROSI|nr:hypothetical protein Tsubulata_026582 [Turnera subulata]
MAQCAASPSCVKPRLWSNCVGERGRLPQNARFRVSQRKYSGGGCKVVPLLTWKSCDGGHLSGRELSCLGSLADLDGATVSNWVYVGDQLLLMTSVFLTYMAGVVPLQRRGFASGKTVLDHNVVLGSPTSSGRKKDDQHNSKHAWDSVKHKLLDSLDALEQGNDVENRIRQVEQQRVSRPLSLYAVSEGPKLRLLWASLQCLEEEACTLTLCLLEHWFHSFHLQVNNVLSDCATVTMDDWCTIFPEVIRRTSNLVFPAWLAKELCLEHNKLEEAFASLLVEKLKGDDIILQTIRKSGKEELYAELLYFLTFRTLRKGSCYDTKLLTVQGVSILEDLVITLADGIASVYLELISVDGNLSNEMNTPDICNLSTRALQRLRNEVALKKWLYQNLETVVLMYEDRFDLCTLQLKLIDGPSSIQTENHIWWKRLSKQKIETTTSSLPYTAITQFSMPVKRTKELRALTGWRYYFSLFLELSDISMPFIKAIMEKFSNAISFFLVSLIGRSVGQIYSGIRQSLRWKK